MSAPDWAEPLGPAKVKFEPPAEPPRILTFAPDPRSRGSQWLARTIGGMDHPQAAGQAPTLRRAVAMCRADLKLRALYDSGEWPVLEGLW